MRVWEYDHEKKEIFLEKELIPASKLAGPVMSFDTNTSFLLACA
jgi:hypothetical protein